ncbi:MAG TPA: hypothetical protein VOB72_06500 [Candidatus Dormibacteraeota bacterium]|nr:hypothetical protein [Candidatus Dormibacteraeota bacterium]
MARWRLRAGLAGFAGLVLSFLPVNGTALAAAGPVGAGINCAGVRSQLCSEVWDTESVFGSDTYVGHDEPSTIFYSNTPGSGNRNQYLLQLPKDPHTLPDGTDSGGTFNFQLHPAFFFGMAMCDTQSSPEFTNQCTPDTDANIFDDADPASPHYIGRHPGAAFMEMQFYPPGWAQWPAGTSCDTTQWCAALNIDSLSQDQNTGVVNNADCLSKAGIEPVNFAFITKNGVAHAPAGPLSSTLDTFTVNRNTDFFMRSGDVIVVDEFDTAAGFEVVLRDLNTGKVGSMTASTANGFEQVNFQPTAATCSATPYAFHPMYSTSSEHTRVSWTAHSYNVVFSDETGHFQFCNSVDKNTGRCLVAGGHDAGSAPDPDDVGCFAASQLPPGSVPVSGCQGTDFDFDGTPYFNTWPGTLPNPGQDHKIHAQPIRFTSPVTNGFQQFDRVAFEADLPRIENQVATPCNRTTGANCVNPPPGAQFYPIFTTHESLAGQACNWQEGGAFIPGTKNTFGGTSTAEYGPLLTLTYPGPGFQPIQRINNFRNVLPNNPCRSLSSMDTSD